MKQLFLKLFTVVALLTQCSLAAAAQGEFRPDRPVRLVVAYTPGGATDIIARVLSIKLGERWGQTVVVENKPGAAGMIGAEQVARARPDGYTLLLAYTPEVSINKLIYRQMRYDPAKDLEPIALVADAPLVLVSGPKLPVQTYQELLARGRKEDVSFASPGTGGQQHLAGELLRTRTGMKLLHVPYKGTSAAVSDLAAGQVDIFFATAPALIGQIRAGKLQPLLITGPERQAVLQTTPTAAEVGLSDFNISNWFGLFGPVGMPAELVGRMSDDVAWALRQPDVIKNLGEQGLNITYKNPANLRKFIAGEMTKYEHIISVAGVQKQ